jgi:hypothetical protein
MAVIRRAVTAGTVLSVTAVSAWSYLEVFTAGPSPVLHLTRHPWADYRQLASAPTGNGLVLFAVTAGVFTACFMVTGLRARRKALRGASREAEQFAGIEAVPVSGRRS